MKYKLRNLKKKLKLNYKYKTKLKKLIERYLSQFGYFAFEYEEGRDGLGVIAQCKMCSMYFPLGKLCAEIFEYER